MPRNRDPAERYSISRLRRSAAIFLAGKGLTAPLNFAAFLVVTAGLPKQEFALYAWLLALGRVSQQLSFLGVNWIALHHLPYYRVRVGGRPYRRFVLAMVAARLLFIAVLVGGYFVAAPYLVAAFGYDAWALSLRLYLAVMAAELSVEFLRASVFEPLLEQGFAQGNVLLQHAVFLVGLWFASSKQGSALTIDHVLYARGVAVWIALIVALVQLASLLRHPEPGIAGEKPLRLRFLLRFALDNYAQDIVRLTAGGQLLTMLASRLVGVPALAMFAFAQNLAGYVDRLQPAQLFLGLLRPRVIAAYVDDRSFAGLARRVALILKVSSCTLAAVIAVIVAVGRPALDLLADGKYASSHGLLLVFLLLLAIVSVGRMQSVLTNVLGRSELLRRASLASLLVVPTAVGLVQIGAGAYGLVLAMIVGEAVSVWMVSHQLRRAGYRARRDARGYGRIVAAAAAAVVVGKLALLILPAGLFSVVAAAAATLSSFVLALRLFRPFEIDERRAIESLLGWKMVLL